MNAHTPHPWTVKQTYSGFRVLGPQRAAVAACRPKYRDAVSRTTARANAHLIAAAPDMRAQLSRLESLPDLWALGGTRDLKDELIGERDRIHKLLLSIDA